MQMEGWMEKWGLYHVQIIKVDGNGRALCCGNERVDAIGGNMMCKLKGWMEKAGHYDVQMKGWMQKIGHYDVQIKRMDG